MARRGLSRLLVSLALFVGSLAWMGFTFQRTVFDASRSEQVIRVLLDNDAVRHALLQEAVSAADAALPAELRTQVSLEELTNAAAKALDDPQVRMSIERSLVDSHRYVVGDLTEPPTLDAALIDAALRQQLTAVRPDLAVVVPQLPPIRVELPTAGLSPIHRVRTLIMALTPLLAMSALCAALAGLVISPDRTGVMRRIGFWAVSVGAIWIALRYALPALSDIVLGDRGAIVSALAEALATGMGIPGTIMFAAGLALLGASMFTGTVHRALVGGDRRKNADRRADKDQARVEARRRKQEDAESAKAARTGRKAAKAADAPGTAVPPSGATTPSVDDPGTYRPPTPTRVAPATVADAGVPMHGPHPGAPSTTGAGTPPGGYGASSSHDQAAAAPAPPQMPAPPIRGAEVAPHSPHAMPSAAVGAAQGENSVAVTPMALAIGASGTSLSGAGQAAPTEAMGAISIPLPRRERSQPAPPPEPTGPLADPTSPAAGLGATFAPEAPATPSASPPSIGSDALHDTGRVITGVALPVAEKSSRSTPRPAPNEWLGGFSMDPKDHPPVAEPAPAPPRWIEGVGYVYDYAPTDTARWIDGLGYVLEDEV